MPQDDVLPEYDSGMRVKHALKHQQSGNTVVIDVDQGAASVFDRGAPLTGRVTITPRKDMHIEKLLIDFQQMELLSRRQIYANSSMVRAISIAKHIVPPNAYPRDKVLRSGLQYSFTFSLVIPHTLNAEQCPHRLALHRQLPPTVGTPFEWCDQSPDVPDKSIVVAYRIRARLCRSGDFLNNEPPLVRQLKYIRVGPSYPPVQLDPKLYEPKVSKLKKGVLKKASAGHIAISFTKPPVIYLTHQTTELKMHIITTVPCIPPTVKSIIYKMTAFTTSSTVPVSYYPEHTVDRTVHSVKDHFQTARASVEQSPQHELMVDQKYYRNTIKFRVYIPTEKEGIVPTYFSCLSSRQYEIEVALELEEYSSISCKVPLVIAQSHDTRYWVKDDESDPVPPYNPASSDLERTYITLGNRSNAAQVGQPKRNNVDVSRLFADYRNYMF